MTKQEAIAEFGGSIRKLADALGISDRAVRQWPDEVPPLRQYQIREILAGKKK